MNRGQSSYNSSIIGWAGHTINGPSENVIEMLGKAMTRYEIELKRLKFESLQCTTCILGDYGINFGI